MATTIAKPETLVGKRIRRQEDPRLITGTAIYLDDIKMPGMHHACVVRSPHAAAKITGINAQPALARPGVVAVFTGADVANLGAVPCAASLPGLRVPRVAAGASVVVTVGGNGAVLVPPGGTPDRYRALPVTPVDSTGAGDAFNGALAVGLAEGRPLAESVRRAVAAAGQSTTVAGAREGMTRLADLERALA